MNPANIVQCLAALVEKNLNLNKTETSQKEREVAEHLAHTRTSISNCKEFEYEEETTIDFDSDTNSEDESGGDGSDGSEELNDMDKEEEHHTLKNYSLEFMEEVLEYAEGKIASRKRHRSWRSIHNRYKSIPDQAYISRFRKYVGQHGTKREKTQNVNEVVVKKIVNAREHFLPIHDLDIQRWALKAAKEMKLENFRASDFWLLNLKHKYNLCSRKITNFVSKGEVKNQKDIEKSELEFVQEYHKLAPKYHAKDILNTDQVGVEKELHSTRTISFQGEKTTLCSVKSKNATTHSYTIQPIISSNGTLVGPMYLCLQEPKGKMGPQVKQHLFEPKNVVITCSGSGKLTTSLVTYWRDH